jgi:hypothetical protein
MRQIRLLQHKTALLDDEDFARLGQYHWCYRGERTNKQGYAIRHANMDGKKKTVYLHREVMAPVPPGHLVVFLNYDTLDCRRANLAVVTKDEARRRRRVTKEAWSNVKGVHYDREAGYWEASVYHRRCNFLLGICDTLEAAEAVYERARLLDKAGLEALQEELLGPVLARRRAENARPLGAAKQEPVVDPAAAAVVEM